MFNIDTLFPRDVSVVVNAQHFQYVCLDGHFVLAGILTGPLRRKAAMPCLCKG